MIIRIPRASDPAPSEITPRDVYMNRRSFLKRAALGAAAVVAGPGAVAACERPDAGSGSGGAGDDELTPYEDVTSYNNFYEFGTGKDDPARRADSLVTEPWTVTVEGHVERTGVYGVDDLLGRFPPEERIYRLRCVEAWSMVIPWMGFPLRDLIRWLEPTSRARYVELTTLFDPEQMPGQRRPILDWPYVEGLRMDEAMNELTLMATGLYGEELPNQNGAPIRLVVPWKYGFKSIKSVVKIRFVEEQPLNTWQQTNPREYGFFANVNPEVDHPRWSQARERRIGELFRRPTRMFNGYGEEVAHLYEGMDLRVHF